ncbi:MAG: hypothetical protein ACPHDO_03775 [Candidatus Poseidoniaceae archaeon]
MIKRIKVGERQMDVHRKSNHNRKATHSKIIDEGDQLISQIKQHLVTYDSRQYEQEANSLLNLKEAGIEVGKLIEFAQELIVAHSLLYHKDMIEKDMATIQWKHSEEVVYSGRSKQLDQAFKIFSNRVNSLAGQMGGLKWD